MLYLKRLAKADFNPPRPFLLGPVITDLDKYKDFHKETETTATVDSESYKGKFIVDVHEIGTSYQSPANPDMKFNDVIKWETRAEGFDGMNKLRGLSFSKFEWHWNTNPIMIPRIYFELMASDVLSDDQQSIASISDSLLGKIKVDLNVISYSDLADE